MWPLFLQQRRLTSIISRLSSAVASQAASLVDTHLMPLGERCITEPRRPYPRRASMQENLAERLTLQRSLRAHLLPSQIIVSKDKLYIDLVWPATALRAVEALKEREALPLKGAADSGGIGSEADGQHGAELAPGTAGRRCFEGSPLEQHRTRFLAEFLRAFSPSTDVVGADVLIYGRRGITITDVIPVGNYALRIVFSDGHSGGIYPYDYLFHLGREKYAHMRAYIRRLRAKRKSRDPPRRAPSRRFSRAQGVSKEEGPQTNCHGRDGQGSPFHS
ncbi:Myb domain protein 40 [Trypanosoma conorhini]|uniref:Myb domain protein 40 n=1 Tax=Trypanosoma conorhini TaxID=83891 RepID=A0A3R7NVS2_9TRYP|nr:Myb domain protein 40 [Trypanosoma conorhini]RNF24467.1 Myb domain protein 40 [Trypanosoma conorhini]